MFSDKLFSNMSAIYSHYNYRLNSIYYQFNPGTIRRFDENSGVIPDQITKKNAFENTIYINAEQKLTDKLSINYGLMI